MSSPHSSQQSKDTVGADERTVPHEEARRALRDLQGPLSHGVFRAAGHAACGIRRGQQRCSALWESLNTESGEDSKHVMNVSGWNEENRLWFVLLVWNPQAAQAPRVCFEAEENSLWTLLLTSPGTSIYLYKYLVMTYVMRRSAASNCRNKLTCWS